MQGIKNTLLVIGIIFQLAGLFCFLTFWLMYFAILFFVVGSILISFSRTRWYIIIGCRITNIACHRDDCQCYVLRKVYSSRKF